MVKRRKGKEGEEGSNEWDLQLREEAAAVAAALLGARRARKRFIGVRQRPSGRWVAEIKDTIQNIRLWLGTYDTAKDAARAYDEAARLLRGANTRTNFSSSPSSHSVSALPAKIAKLLLLRIKASRRNIASSNCMLSTPFPTEHYDQQNTKAEPEPEPHFLNQIEEPCLESFPDLTTETGIFAGSYDGASYASYGSAATTTADYSGGSTNEANFNQEGCGEDLKLEYDCGSNIYDRNDQIMREKGEFEDCDVGLVDFNFLDTVESMCYSCSAVKIVEEMVGPLQEEKYNGDEPPFLRELLRLEYERKFSACLYTLVGVSECLSLQVGSENGKGLDNI